MCMQDLYIARRSKSNVYALGPSETVTMPHMKGRTNITLTCQDTSASASVLFDQGQGLNFAMVPALFVGLVHFSIETIGQIMTFPLRITNNSGSNYLYIIETIFDEEITPLPK